MCEVPETGLSVAVGGAVRRPSPLAGGEVQGGEREEVRAG